MARTKATKPTDAEQVTAWLKKLPSDFKPAIEALRKIIKAAGPELNERIKWNAPSYYFQEDIVTFGPMKARDKIILVFHHPSIVKIKSALLQGDHKDRRLVYLNSLNEIKEAQKELGRIIKESVQLIGK